MNNGIEVIMENYSLASLVPRLLLYYTFLMFLDFYHTNVKCQEFKLNLQDLPLQSMGDLQGEQDYLSIYFLKTTFKLLNFVSY